MTKPKILFLSMDGMRLEELAQRFPQDEFEVVWTHSDDHAKKELLTGRYDVLVHRFDSLAARQFELLRFLQQHQLSTKAIYSAITGDIQDVVRAMRGGATDFIVGKVADPRLLESITKCFQVNGRPSSETITPLPAPPKEIGPALIGESSAMTEIQTAINLVATAETPVLITGESGTGKEIVARLIHLRSNRMDKPFFALNCAALPKDVIENELFGHERGAFTGAISIKAGCFELADEGTLFFDEIAEMNPATQAKLLRAIETKSFRRLGGRKEVAVNIRLIAATNKDIQAALKSGDFRQDLYYRFSVVEVFLPPLRDRKTDIPLLVDYFLSDFKEKYGRSIQRFSEEAMDMLMTYEWPGNVRELRNVIERAVVTSHDDVIDVRCLPDAISRHKPLGHSISIPVGISAQEAERLLILNTLASVGYNKSRAAKILGLSRKTLHNKLRAFEEMQKSSTKDLVPIE